MSVCLFLTYRADGGLDPRDIASLDAAFHSQPALQKALIHTSTNVNDPYLKDEAPPQLVLQLYFATLPELEAAAARGGLVGTLTSQRFPSLAAAAVTQQAMLVRTFAVPEPGLPGCTYLVAYEGEAQDFNAWLSHYLGKHTVHMARFPAIRELEVYTRVDWVSELPLRRVNFMQRNKVAFDTVEALSVALHSPVRHEMRTDYYDFPPFTGSVSHFAMSTRTVRP
jgi:hypothetical protein